MWDYHDSINITSKSTQYVVAPAPVLFEGQLYDVEDTLKFYEIDYLSEMYKEPAPVLVDNPFEVIEELRTDIQNLIKEAKPLKAEKKDLQIKRLEDTVEKLKELEQSLDGFFNKDVDKPVSAE